MADNKFLPKLSQNLLEILEDDKYCDVAIEVGNNPYIRIFRAHMVILHYRSPYLRRILPTNNDGTLSQIKLPNISPEIFQIILRYIYGGRLSLEEYDTSDIIKILSTSIVLGLYELVNYLQSFLIENKENWMEQNFNLVYQTSFEHDSLLELQNYCTDLMFNEPGKIFGSPDFVSIPEKVLVSLIRSDNLQMSEVQVWEYVLKWCLAHNPDLSSDPSSYSRDDFNALKNTLRPYIPHIRFYNLTSREFLDKVYRFRNALSEELCDSLFQYFLDPDNNRPNDISGPRGVNRIISTNITDESRLNEEIPEAREETSTIIGSNTTSDNHTEETSTNIGSNITTHEETSTNIGSNIISDNHTDESEEIIENTGSNIISESNEQTYIEIVETSMYQQKLVTMAEYGFTDEAKNLQTLINCDGNLENAINLLLIEDEDACDDYST